MYICKNTPQLSEHYEYKDPSCFQKSLNDASYDSFVFGPDTNVTTDNKTESINEFGYYYVTFLTAGKVGVMV